MDKRTADAKLKVHQF